MLRVDLRVYNYIRAFTSDRRKLLEWALAGFAFCLPISAYVAVRILLLALIISLFVREDRAALGARWIRRSWDLFLYFFVLAVGVIYSANRTTAWGVLETNVVFLGLSLAIARLSPFDDDTRNRLLRAFVSGVFISSLVCVATATGRFLVERTPDVFLSYKLTEVIGSHPTYTAYFIIFSITYLMAGYSSGLSRLKGWQLWASVLFLFLFLLLTGGQTAFVGMLLVIAFFVLRFFTDEAASHRRSLAILSLLMLGLLLANSTYMPGFNDSDTNDSWERYYLWRSAVEANDNYVFGVGTGDYKDELNSYYRVHNMDEYEKGSFNAHNQFIHSFLSNGILGVLAFVLLIAHPLYLAVKHGSALGVLTFFPFIIYAMTEVYLGRLQGVAFYALLHQSFVPYFEATQRAAVLKG